MTTEYLFRKKKYIVVAAVSVVLFIAALLLLVVTVRGIFPWTEYHVIVFLALAGIFGVVFSTGTMEAYEILVYNDNHSNSIWFKVIRKAKSKIEKW